MVKCLSSQPGRETIHRLKLIASAENLYKFHDIVLRFREPRQLKFQNLIKLQEPFALNRLFLSWRTETTYLFVREWKAANFYRYNMNKEVKLGKYKPIRRLKKKKKLVISNPKNMVRKRYEWDSILDKYLNHVFVSERYFYELFTGKR